MIEQVILFCGGNPDLWPDLPRNLEKSYLIGVDRGAYEAYLRGYSIDYAIGDFDSLTESEWIKLSKHVERMDRHPKEKDETDTELALLFAIQRFPELPIIIIGATGGRLDHFLANLLTVLKPQFKQGLNRVTFKDSQNTISMYGPGKYVVPKEKGKHYVSFISLTPIKNLRIQGMKYPLKATSYEYPCALISNEWTGEIGTVDFETGILAILYSTD